MIQDEERQRGNSQSKIDDYKHKTFEDRLAEYDNKISVCEYDWGDPQGKEI